MIEPRRLAHQKAQQARLTRKNGAQRQAKVAAQEAQTVVPADSGGACRVIQCRQILVAPSSRHPLAALRPVQVNERQTGLRRWRISVQQKVAQIQIAMIEAGGVHAPRHLGHARGQRAPCGRCQRRPGEIEALRRCQLFGNQKGMATCRVATTLAKTYRMHGRYAQGFQLPYRLIFVACTQHRQAQAEQVLEDLEPTYAAVNLDEIAPTFDLGAKGAASGHRPIFHPWQGLDLADIRSIGSTVQIVEAATAQVIGTIESGAAHNTAHPGAVYVHRGETWLVKSLDLDNAVAVIERSDPSYSTTAREVTDIKIASTHEQVDWGDSRLCLGEVEVTHQVVSYLQRRVPGGEVIGEQPLDLPARTLRTNAVWWIVPDELLSAADFDPLDLPGAAHAAEHCAIAMLPLFATCDRWDIGGVSTALHPDTGCLTVFVYDGHPGGAGFAERGFQAASDWLSATRDAIASCECSAGCPSCIQSPKCGNQNNPLDKVGAIRLLDVLLTGAPTT